MGDDTGLARACACKDQHRAVDGFHSLALRRVERAQVEHRARSLVCEQVNASRLRLWRNGKSECSAGGGDILLDLPAQGFDGREFLLIPQLVSKGDFHLLTVEFA